jgi:hypothetical protein
MCDECIGIDKALAQFRRASKQGFDPLTNDRLQKAIADMERRKAALHPSAP